MTKQKEKHPDFLPENRLVSIRGLHKEYGNSGERIQILTDARFDIDKGETAAVTGASGIGKSTFLHIVGTLDLPDKGEIFFQGKDVLKFNETRLSRFRNEYIGFVFQFHHLLFEFTALENTMMPALIKGDKKNSAREKATALLSKVGLGNRLNHRIGELSGGEQQRVALARALVQNPLILLADEPTGNLDEKNSDMVHQLLLELNREYGMTMIVVTHNNELAQYMNRRITIADGKLVEQE